MEGYKMIPIMKEQRHKETINVINEINKVLEESKNKMKKKQVYEILLKKNIIEVGTYKSFSHYFDAGIKDSLIDLTKVDLRKARKSLQDPFTKKELIKFFDNLNIDEPEIAMEMLIAFYCALRVNEDCNLKWSDFDFENLQINIEHGKNRMDNQKVSFPREIVPILQLWREYCSEAKYFIPNRIERKRIGISREFKSLERDFDKIRKRAGLDEIKRYDVGKDGKKKPRFKYVFHTLRRTRAVFLHRYEGWSIRQIQVFLRHLNIQTTTDYVNVDDNEIRNLLDNQPYRFRRPEQQVTEQEPTPLFKLEVMKELNKKAELELKKMEQMKELKELEVNIERNSK